MNRDIEFFEDSFVTQGADPEAKILEKVANRSGNIGIQKHSTNNRNNFDHIINENNQRSTSGRIETFANKLKDIPWT